MKTRDKLYIFELDNGYRATLEAKDFTEAIRKAQTWYGQKVARVTHWATQLKKELK